MPGTFDPGVYALPGIYAFTKTFDWLRSVYGKPTMTEAETEPPVTANYYETAPRRWTFSRYSKGIPGIRYSLHREVQLEDGRWRGCYGYFSIVLDPRFEIARTHLGYEGPHHGLSLGFLRLFWQWWPCAACEREWYDDEAPERQEGNWLWPVTDLLLALVESHDNSEER